MAMKSSQIREALKYLTDTVVAFSAAAEVVAAAEDAEVKIKEHPAKLKAIEQREEEVRQQLASLEASYLKAKGDYSNDITALETSKTKAKQSAVDANKELDRLTGQINKQQIELTRLRDHGRAEVDDEIKLYRQSKAEQIANIDAQVAEKESQLDKAVKAYERFKKSSGLA